jgi:large subunit ribosomal protein L20
MPRSVNAVASRARRKRFMKLAKGYWGRKKNVWTVAKNAIEKGLVHAFQDVNKRNVHSEECGFSVSTPDHAHGMSYSVFIGKVNKKGIKLNSKVSC